ncbi:SAM-dependent methyltransferase [Friedmanniella endophytica]|uniref:SAM-dependent methyltransferase n=1 Tax=Microlunatus kandeliicorticis TaxID=1759536 RepID=A0A7W3ISV7_9ACTN|nr:class I SAM-dependent methyltransferase [Microlunatus kandeliicorticis]MBA8794612.1 SAM-dependent methyltransferase [Microlunatus kandeliicorticis]
MPSDADRTRQYYDALGEREWTRLTDSVAGRVAFEVHRRFLARFVRAGDRVLEIGAGPGRFTLELAALGARIVVTDLSPVQLELNRRHVGPTDAERRVEQRIECDVRDTAGFGDGAFDAVVAFGGPLSYAFEEAEQAVRGLLRVVGPRGVVLASVMSTLGTWRQALPSVTGVAERVGDEVNDAVLADGDLRLIDRTEHACRMFRWRQLRDLVEQAGGRVVAASASNWASLGDPSVLEPLERDPDRWRHFLDNEVGACAEPGALDGGTHLIFAATSAA